MEAMTGFLSRWLILTLSVLAAAHLVPGIEYRGVGALLAASLLLGLLNAVVRPLLVALSLPLVIVSFGLFLLAINTALFYITGHFVRGFVVHSWTAAFFGSVICSALGVVLRGLRRVSSSTITLSANRRRASDGHRVIDI